MKYRILLLLTLLCAIPAAATGGTFASYSYETTYSFSIAPEAGGTDLRVPQSEATATPETPQIAEPGKRTPAAEIQPQQTEEAPAGPDTQAAEEPEVKATKEPSQEVTDAVQKPLNTPDAEHAAADIENLVQQ